MSWNPGPLQIYVVAKLFERPGRVFQKAADRHSNQTNCLSLDCNLQHAKGDHAQFCQDSSGKLEITAAAQDAPLTESCKALTAFG